MASRLVQVRLGYRRGTDTGREKPGEQFRLRVAAIESVAELVHIALQVHVVNSTERIQQETFGHEDADVDPWPLCRGLLARDGRFIMVMTQFIQILVGRLYIGAKALLWLNVRLNQAFYCPLIDRGDRLHRRIAGLLAFGLHHHHHEGVILGAAGGFSRGGGSDNSISDLDKTPELIAAVAFPHRLTCLVQRWPSRFVFQLQLLGRARGRSTPFALTDEIDLPETLARRSTGLVEYRPGSQRDLLAAMGTFPLAMPLQFVGMVMTAMRILETFRPSGLFKRLFTLSFGTEPLP